MPQLYAQPYDLDVVGFYFETAKDYNTKANALRNAHGEPVEEFEIQFIDGETINCALAEAIGISQGNIAAFFDAVEDWEEHQKFRCIIALTEGGLAFDFKTDDIDLLDVDLYGVESLRELAEKFVDDGIFGNIPGRLQFYIDYDAIARDLGMDYSEITIAGERFVYRCG